ncbi:glycosyltransferase family 2 protein [Streptomyces kaempferi]
MHQTLTSDSFSCLELPTYVSMIMRTSPMISVIVAAHDLQGQLESCLRSILNQSFRDLEVVAVLDQSPECPANVVDDYAQRDGRVSVVRLKGVVGIGRIRNAGAEHAAGDYLLFLDSDHIVRDTTLQAMADQLQATDEPDVLLFGHTRLHHRRSWHGAAAELIAQQGRESFAPIDLPELFGAPAYSWDRLFRRDMWTRQHLSFPDGLYEEVSAVHRAMLAADRIGVLKWNCVQIRRSSPNTPQTRQAAPTSTSSPGTKRASVCCRSAPPWTL